MLDNIDVKIGSYKITQTSFDTIKIVKNDMMLTLFYFSLFFGMGFLFVFETFDMDILTGLTFIATAFFIGFSAGARERFVVDRGAKVFTSSKISLFGTTTFSKQERIYYEQIRAQTVKKEVEYEGETNYVYIVGFVVNYRNYDFLGSSSGESEKEKCEEVCEVINNFCRLEKNDKNK